MKSHKKILIGTLNKNNQGAIPTITKAFIDGLSQKYSFIPFYQERNYFNNRHSSLNIINIFYFFRDYIKWIWLVIKSKPDIAHYPVTSYWNFEKSLLFLTTAKMLGVRITIGHVHGGVILEFLSSMKKIREKIDLNLFNNIDCIIALSDYWKSNLSKYFSGDLFVVNNPIDEKFENYFRNKCFSNNRSILFIGSIGRKKGVYDIVEAASQLNAIFTINIVGPEDRRNDLNNIKQMINKKKIGSKVILQGPLYGDDKITMFKNCGIFLFPSYSENFPLVIIEAACAGLAIITTPVGAIPEFFKHDESALFVEPGNVDQIKAAIQLLLNDTQKRYILGQEARKVFVEKLSREKIMNSLDNVYNYLLNKS